MNSNDCNSIRYLFRLINFSLILLLLILSEASFSQVNRKEYSNDLIVGELLGRVDTNDLWSLIQSNYYPVVRDNSNIKLERIESSPQMVIFKVHYPNEGTSVHPNRIIFRFFESEYSLIAGVITEQVDFAITESYEAAEEIHNSTSSFKIHFRFKPSNFVKMIGYNNQHHIMRNKNVRKALTYAINRHYIFNDLLRRAADLADGPLSHESKLRISGLEEYKFNPRKAFQLLQNEYWIDTDGDDILDKNGKPFRISLTYEKGVLLDEQLVTRIKINWNKLGIDIIRNPLIKSEIKNRLVERNYDVVLMNQQFQETIESFESFFKSSSRENILGYKSRTVDHYINLYKIGEPSSRKLLLQAIQKQINNDHPAAFLFFLWLERYFVNRVKFTNFQDENGDLLPFTEWYLK